MGKRMKKVERRRGKLQGGKKGERVRKSECE